MPRFTTGFQKKPVGWPEKRVAQQLIFGG
jgi:hypothetical protein